MQLIGEGVAVLAQPLPLIDAIIALSVVFVGVVGIRGRPTDMRPFAARW